jgi:uracil-DNA glycosylase family 4
MFTGDNSGLWLYRALYTAGFASKPESLHRNDGMSLIDCYITAAVRCVPPKNKPTPKEIANCRSYLLREIRILSNIRVVIGLGKVGFDAVADALREVGHIQFTSRPRFVHGKSYHYAGVTLIASYHPSQQNTFTGKLTEALFDRVFRNARELLR